jgi:hypothetical protein
MSKINDLLNPKRIIFDAVKSKLEGTGVIKLVLVFNVQNDQYNIMLAKEDNTSMKIDIDEKEISLIKKVLTNKIRRTYEQNNDRPVKSIIIQMDLRSDDIQVFIMDLKDNVEPFTLNI